MLLLIIGNELSKRVIALGYVIHLKQPEEKITWCRFYNVEEDKEEENSKKQEDKLLDRAADELEGVAFTAFDLSKNFLSKNQYKKKQQKFVECWEETTSLAIKKSDSLVIEDLDAVLKEGWLDPEDIDPLLNQFMYNKVIITGMYLPTNVLEKADKVIEVWERNNG